MELDETEFEFHHLIEYPLQPLVIKMPRFSRRSTLHPFCSDKLFVYSIEWQKDDNETVQYARSARRVKSPLAHDLIVLYDADNIYFHANNPVTAPGHYTLRVSPNDGVESVTMSVTVCYVNEPRKLFDDDFSAELDDENESDTFPLLKFREDDRMNSIFALKKWPVIGGSDDHQCGFTEVKLSSDDPRIYDDWFTYSTGYESNPYIEIDPDHYSAPNVTKEGE